MKILLKTIVFLLLNVVTYSLKMSDPTFDKKIIKGEKASKIYTIENNSLDKKIYELKFENENNLKKVTPNRFLLNPQGKKDILVEIGTNSKTEIGSHEDLLIIREKVINIEKNNSSTSINMTYRVKQKYIVDKKE
ncbi:hypothetical protein [Cetobacterium sp.]|uniref:hypothetical protein n=1 Tax=Cetobacterium sp. TaxID=2071632 RepID=UPI003EE74BB0